MKKTAMILKRRTARKRPSKQRMTQIMKLRKIPAMKKRRILKKITEETCFCAGIMR